MTAFVGVWNAPTFVAGVDEAQLDAIRGLFAVWQAKYPRNLLRSQYRDMRVRIKPSGNIPAEAIARVEAVSEWPDKAVSALAERSVFEGFVSPGGMQDPFELAGILDANRFDLELPQAITSAYTHSCSFITTALGDVASGEPEVLIMARDALWSVARWDTRRRVVRDALTITDTDDHGQPTAMDAWFPDVILSLTRRPSGSWVAVSRPNTLNEVLVEPLMYDPQLGRPFGRSRISRAVMNITDRALLTIIRSELASDFYAAPRMYALGVAEDAFSRGKWQAAIDRWFAISKDEDGDTPTVGQFPQMTMQPLTDMYRTIATQFSGATGVPVSNLGIVTDNPPSAEALYADDRRIVNTARTQNRIMGGSLKRVGQRVVRLRDGRDVSDELSRLDTSWANPSFTSPSTSADALVKLSSVFPWLSESEVALEFAGFSHAEITRLLSDKRRAQGGSVLNQVLARQTPAVQSAVPDDVAG
ncbi:phage portal protein [Microbacterium sp. CBA3102]|uniref:phage portal protein n=1 Tax=Microbacterium sp. CBA3102 TaxID=2603598 RepID=UPI0011BB27AA|nr:phage portal protein [Microbacterium sp. CBA3102]QEA30399.1 phage portal protein [Microbacterium sp. CBA3102]